MAGFTEAEVSEAVDRYLTTQVSVPVTKTGARDINAARSLIYDLITSTLLLRPDSFFYVVWLATNRLQALIKEQVAALSEINQMGPLLSRPSKGIQSTSELVNAKAAILEVNAGMNARQQGVRGSIGPAVIRFRRSVTRFINEELTKNVLVGSSVTETGDELRAKLSTLWADAVVRHEEIVALTENVVGALSQLNQTALPQSSIGAIVERIQARLEELQQVLEGPSAIQQSREAMLDLLTMRTLLAKASSFRNPQLLLMPLAGDGTQLTLLDGAGTEASISSSVSGPYTYGPGTSLAVSVGGAPVALGFPGHTSAEIRSSKFLVWTDPPATSEIAFTLDLTGTSGPYVTAGPYGSGPAAAAAFDAALPGITVTWDVAASQLVFRSDSFTDSSALSLLVNTPSRLAFLNWGFVGASYSARATPQSASGLAKHLSSLSTSLDFVPSEASYGSFTGIRTSTLGEEAIIFDLSDQGVNLVADGSSVVTSPTKNFEGLGVQTGMAIKILLPPASAGDYEITQVSGSSLTLSAPVSATLSGVYYLGPDYRAVPDGARVQVVSQYSQANSGFYRVATGGGQIARIVVDRNIPSEDPALGVSIYGQSLKLRARGTTTSSGVGALVASSGATALGVPLTPAEVPASLATLEIMVGQGDFLFRNVRAGDRIDLTSPSSVMYTRSVASVSATRLTLAEPVPYEIGSWGYRITSTRVSQYNTVAAAGSSFSTSPSVTGFDTLDLYVGRLIRGAQYSSQISGAIGGYGAALSSLLSSLVAYTVPKERGIDNAIKTMREQGLDRAVDLFLGLEIKTFFSMEADGASYATWLINRSSLAARNLAPVTKYAKSMFARQEWRLLSFQTNQVDPLGTGNNDR